MIIKLKCAPAAAASGLAGVAAALLAAPASQRRGLSFTGTVNHDAECSLWLPLCRFELELGFELVPTVACAAGVEGAAKAAEG
jgi:hypothetical protein